MRRVHACALGLGGTEMSLPQRTTGLHTSVWVCERVEMRERECMYIGSDWVIGLYGHRWVGCFLRVVCFFGYFLGRMARW
jgi:hypothetical protein